MAEDNASFEDLLINQGGHDDNVSPFDVEPTPTASAAPAAAPDSGMVTQLKEQRRQLREQIRTALTNNYEGYKLDTDSNGQPYFGTRGYARFEADKLAEEDLKEQIAELEVQQQQFSNLSRQSSSSAAAAAKQIFARKIAFIDKGQRPAVTSEFKKAFRSVDWGTPQLHSEAARNSLLEMLFNNAAHTVTEEHRRQRRQSGMPASQEADTGDASDGGGTAPKVNEFGHEEGSVAWKVSERYKQRQQSSGIAADVYRQQNQRKDS